MPTLSLAAGVPQWMGWLYGGVAAAAAVIDYRTGKIHNWLTFPAMALGLVVAACSGAVVAALSGLALACALFAPLFFLGIFGGGDVKLLMALGTVLGARGLAEVAGVSILVAALGAIVLLFVHRRARAFVSELAKFFRTLATPGLSAEWPKLRRDIKAPFGLAIFWAFAYVVAGGGL